MHTQSCSLRLQLPPDDWRLHLERASICGALVCEVFVAYPNIAPWPAEKNGLAASHQNVEGYSKPCAAPVLAYFLVFGGLCLLVRIFYLATLNARVHR